MQKRRSNRSWYWLAGLLACATVYAIGLLHGRYSVSGWPFLKKEASVTRKAVDEAEHDHAQDSHDEHGHGHTDENSLELSETARKNLGLTEEFTKPIELKSFERTLTVPAIIGEVPGRTRLPISAPMSGVITHVHSVAGEAIHSGDLVLEMRLTHEDLVTAQKEYLQSLGELDIEQKEIARLEPSASAGVIAPKTLLDRQYSRDKVAAALRSQREALRLHGLSESQISMIDSQRKLLTEIRIIAPNPDDHSEEEIRLSKEPSVHVGRVNASLRPQTPALPLPLPSLNVLQPAAFTRVGHSQEKHLLVLQDLLVQKGQIVAPGDLLCRLADYQVLLVEGQSFENEADLIIQAKSKGWSVAGLIEEGGQLQRVENLQFEWIDNEINPTTRALKFYVSLPNTLVLDSTTATNQRHISWRYRVGQRMQLQVPIEKWEDQIVLPVDAVVREGIESYVFQENGDHFDRVAVHEYFRDQTWVVIENDGSLFPGDVVALRGAHQLLMALKNKAGSGADPHAGHNH